MDERPWTVKRRRLDGSLEVSIGSIEIDPPDLPHDAPTSVGGKRTWEGGAYEGREGIEVEATPDGVVISAWYDGGVSLDVVATLAWSEVEALRFAHESP